MSAREVEKKDKNYRRIVDLSPGLRGINCTFIVLEKGGVTHTKNDHAITHCVVADESAKISLSLWDTQGDTICSGDIIRLVGGYCSLYKMSLVLYSGCMHGTLERVGRYHMLFKEQPNMSGVTWSTDPNSKLMSSPELAQLISK